MAHDITIRDNGIAEAAFALTPAWHNLGTVLDQPWTVYTVAVRCTCDSAYGRGWMPDVYDPKQMLAHAIPLTTDDEERARMALFVQSRKPANYHDEFSNFA
jgi:hypothetical protein